MPRLRFVALAVAVALTPGAAWSQAFPSQPIRIIVPFAAGGNVDVTARAVAPIMSDSLRQPVVVENRPGAGGMLAAGFVMSSKPDGHTLMMGSNSTLSVGPVIQKNWPYDPLKGITPIINIQFVPFALVVRADSEIRSASDLIARAKAKPGAITQAHAGVGSSNHLVSEFFQMRTGAKFLLVPYKGAAPAMTDVIGGQVQTFFDQASTTVAQVQGGKIRALAVTAAQRMAALPEVPTFKEAGIERFEILNVTGLVGPAGMDPAVVAKIRDATVTALEHPGVKEVRPAGGCRSASSRTRLDRLLAAGSILRGEFRRMGRSASGRTRTSCACSGAVRWLACAARWSRIDPPRWPASCPPGTAWRRAGESPVPLRGSAALERLAAVVDQLGRAADPARRSSNVTCCRRGCPATSRGCSTSSGRSARWRGSGGAASGGTTGGSRSTGRARDLRGCGARRRSGRSPVERAPRAGSASTSRGAARRSTASCTRRPAAGRTGRSSMRSGTSSGPARSRRHASLRCGRCAGSGTGRDRRPRPGRLRPGPPGRRGAGRSSPARTRRTPRVAPRRGRRSACTRSRLPSSIATGRRPARRSRPRGSRAVQRRRTRSSRARGGGTDPARLLRRGARRGTVAQRRRDRPAPRGARRGPSQMDRRVHCSRRRIRPTRTAPQSLAASGRRRSPPVPAGGRCVRRPRRRRGGALRRSRRDVAPDAARLGRPGAGPPGGPRAGTARRRTGRPVRETRDRPDRRPAGRRLGGPRAAPRGRLRQRVPGPRPASGVGVRPVGLGGCGDERPAPAGRRRPSLAPPAASRPGHARGRHLHSEPPAACARTCRSPRDRRACARAGPRSKRRRRDDHRRRGGRKEPPRSGSTTGSSSYPPPDDRVGHRYRPGERWRRPPARARVVLETDAAVGSASTAQRSSSSSSAPNTSTRRWRRWAPTCSIRRGRMGTLPRCFAVSAIRSAPTGRSPTRSSTSGPSPGSATSGGTRRCSPSGSIRLTPSAGSTTRRWPALVATARRLLGQSAAGAPGRARTAVYGRAAAGRAVDAAP